MLSAWGMALGVPRLNLSAIEKPWTGEFWGLVFISLVSFTAGFFAGHKVFKNFHIPQKFSFLSRSEINFKYLRIAIYVLFVLSLAGLKMFYDRAGNFPLLDISPDVFRFEADEKVPGLINYTAQLARLFIPLSFALMFWQGFAFKKHWDLIVINLLGIGALILFASRTQFFMADLWIMALYLFIRKPNLKQALKFYPVFLLLSVIVLAAVPLIRQARSYGDNYLANVTAIDTERVPGAFKYALPIYVGISFNMQALMHANDYYQQNPIQMGKVTLDPFTNILGLDSLKSNFDLGAIFHSWWNTGTYLFPFVQDFGSAAFFFVPFIVAFVLSLLWRYMQKNPNFLSINLYAYACFFIVMTIYLSFTVRAEMYIDLFILLILYVVCSRFADENIKINSK